MSPPFPDYRHARVPASEASESYCGTLSRNCRNLSLAFSCRDNELLFRGRGLREDSLVFICPAAACAINDQRLGSNQEPDADRQARADQVSAGVTSTTNSGR